MELPADGISRGRITISQGPFRAGDSFYPESHYTDLPLKVLSMNQRDGATEMVFQSTKTPGDADIETRGGLKLTLHFYEPPFDADGDLFPDDAELHSEDDRKAFVDWFLRIAEAQFKRSNFGWNRRERDCSGLIRYAYREALKLHDRDWYRKNGITIDKNLPDVESFHYPDIPVLNKRIFKTKGGSASDPQSFGVFADAETLMRWNTAFVSRDLLDARPGDILFFHDPQNFGSAYHSVIVVKNDLQLPILLYHTGSEQGIKRIAADYLMSSRTFAPADWNSNFIGVHRFHIIQ
jgi:hypothetical protein